MKEPIARYTNKYIHKFFPETKSKMMEHRMPTENEELQVEGVLETVPSDFLSDFDNETIQQLLGAQGPASTQVTAIQRNHTAPAMTGIQFTQNHQQLLQFTHQLEQVPTLKVYVSNSIIRFRYQSELNNRKLGKEELVKISLPGYHGRAEIILHAIDKDNKKAHPYKLIGDHCENGMYISEESFSKPNNYECTCRATLLVPKRNEYKECLKARKKMAELKLITREEMRQEDYWTTNQAIKDCKDFMLFVEVRVRVNNKLHYLYDYSPILINAKDGRSFEIYRISPFSAPCKGITSSSNYPVIILTKQSLIPNENVEVVLEDTENNWKTNSEKVNVIKNCIEFEVPPYLNEEIDEPRTVKLKLFDRQKDLETATFDFIYEPAVDQVLAKRRRKTPKFNVPDAVMQESHRQLESLQQQPRKPPLKASLQRNKNARQVQSGQAPQEGSVNPLPQLVLKQEPVSPQSNCTVSSANLLHNLIQGTGTVNQSAAAPAVTQGSAMAPQYTSVSLVPSSHGMGMGMATERYDIDQLLEFANQGATENNKLDDIISEVLPQSQVKQEPGSVDEANTAINQIIEELRQQGATGQIQAQNLLAGNFAINNSMVMRGLIQGSATQDQQRNIFSVASPHGQTSGFPQRQGNSNMPTNANPTYHLSYSLPANVSQPPVTQPQNFNRSIDSLLMQPPHQDFLGSHLVDPTDANDLETDTLIYINNEVKLDNMNSYPRYNYFDCDDLETDSFDIPDGHVKGQGHDEKQSSASAKISLDENCSVEDTVDGNVPHSKPKQDDCDLAIDSSDCKATDDVRFKASETLKSLSDSDQTRSDGEKCSEVCTVKEDKSNNKDKKIEVDPEGKDQDCTEIAAHLSELVLETAAGEEDNVSSNKSEGEIKTDEKSSNSQVKHDDLDEKETHHSDSSVTKEEHMENKEKETSNEKFAETEKECIENNDEKISSTQDENTEETCKKEDTLEKTSVPMIRTEEEKLSVSKDDKLTRDDSSKKNDQGSSDKNLSETESGKSSDNNQALKETSSDKDAKDKKQDNSKERSSNNEVKDDNQGHSEEKSSDITVEDKDEKYSESTDTKSKDISTENTKNKTKANKSVDTQEADSISSVSRQPLTSRTSSDVGQEQKDCCNVSQDTKAQGQDRRLETDNGQGKSYCGDESSDMSESLQNLKL